MLIGGLGAIFGYAVLFYSTRIKDKEQLPKIKLVIIVVDLAFIIFFGMVWTRFMIDPTSIQAAFASGLAAEVSAMKTLLPKTT